jgi:hypothetical protein
LFVGEFFSYFLPEYIDFFSTGGQGPHLFLETGLRGEVSFVSTEKDADMGQAHTASGIVAQREREPVLVSDGTTKRLLDHVVSKKTMPKTPKTKAAPPFNFEKALKIPARRLSTAKITTLERKLIVRRLSDDYIEITSGSCGGSGYEEIQSRSACSSALASCSSCSHTESGLKADDSRSSYPPGCYIRMSSSYAGNYFNSDSSSTSCTSDRRCVCKKSAASGTSCVTGKDDKMCQNGGTPTGDVCSKPCGCNCPTGTSGEWCECLDCPQESELQWAVSKFVSCETGPTCDCTSGNGLSCKAVETQRGWKPAHREGLCGKASCSDDKEKSRRLAAATTPSASENAITNATEYGGCCSSPELLSKAVLSPTPFCRANPEQFTVVQVCLLCLLCLLFFECY